MKQAASENYPQNILHKILRVSPIKMLVPSSTGEWVSRSKLSPNCPSENPQRLAFKFQHEVGEHVINQPCEVFSIEKLDDERYCMVMASGRNVQHISLLIETEQVRSLFIGKTILVTVVEVPS